MKIIITTVVMVIVLGNTGCTFTAGPASGSLKYHEVKRTPGPVQVSPDRQTHRPFGKNPKPRPHY